MQPLNLKPTHKLVTNYYQALGQFGQLNIDHEMAVRDAFQDLLKGCGRQFDWTLVPEYSFTRPKLTPIRIDGALLDTVRLPRGYWEAKDEHDDLEKEIRAKLAKGYPSTNIIFQAPTKAVLYQHGARQELNQDITDGANLVELLQAFFAYRPPHIEEWEDAVKEFKDHIPQIADAVKEKIEKQRRSNPAFVQRFDAFYELCRQSINPNLSVAAVEEMLIQHLMTERIFRRIFDNSDFTRRNVIAVEIEKIIDSMTAREFSRDAFLKDLDRYYRAIELAAENTETYKQKQDFINTVYERFFQGYSPKEADTHGIVYTPQPIVDFMVRSVEDILKREFGRSLSDKDVHILDPFVGTGNFITRVMKEIKTSALPYKYENELHCNEVMLLPYYVASMNIEHEYLERTGEYKAFPGICLVDTFELAEPEQSKLSFMTEENTERVKRQKRAPIFVIVGNPPYNVGQTDEHDRNKNRKYPTLDKHIRDSYARDSQATLLTKLSDPYVRAIRWASERIGNEGIISLVTNNSFVDQIAFDGMRKHLGEDFDAIYVLDLGGNVRKNPKLSGTTHNVFGIQVGVSINVFVRRAATRSLPCEIQYARCGEFLRKEAKYAFLTSCVSVADAQWLTLTPDHNHNWLHAEEKPEFGSFTPIGLKDQKTSHNATSVFSSFSYGVVTARDTWAYSFSRSSLELTVEKLVEHYNSEAYAWRKKGRPDNIADFVLDRNPIFKWTRRLIRAVSNNVELSFDSEEIRPAMYRPFTKQFLYFDKTLNEEIYTLPHFWPKADCKNTAIWVKLGSEWPFLALAIDCTPDALPQGGSQSFPFYGYDSGGRYENITNWALNEFRTHYSDPNITKWDIFHYAYAVLHHPEYRERYAANLKRELPRIPYEIDFRAFANAGRRLADLHVNYEQQLEYPLERVEKGQLNWRVEKMRLGKDKTLLIYNEFLTLRGIPPETYEYRLGNRSALEWVIDQYQISTDKRSGITNDPNRADDLEYIVRLIGQVITVSLETMKIVKALPSLRIAR